MLREIARRAAVVVGLVFGPWGCIWFGWDTFMVRLGLPSLTWVDAWGATCLFYLIIGAVYLLKETSE